MKFNITHNQSENNFVCKLKDIHAVLSYSRQGEALVLERLFIPEIHQDSEVPERLIKAAFSYCQNHNLKAIPLDPYIKDNFLPEHPQYNSLVRQDPGPAPGSEFLRL
ncbi:MAG: N-acetyltransferase [bacterium]